MTSQLAKYEAMAKEVPTIFSLRYIIKDIREALDAQGRDTDTDYTKKLWAEFDAYTTELQRRTTS